LELSTVHKYIPSAYLIIEISSMHYTLIMASLNGKSTVSIEAARYTFQHREKVPDEIAIRVILFPK